MSHIRTIRSRRTFLLPLALASLAALAALPAANAATAKDGDVVKRVRCSAGSTAKLKLSEEDGRIEVELEVDQNRSGVAWQVRVTRAGAVVFAGSRTTRGPSGSFTVRRVVSNLAGPDRFVARATRASGEVCRVSATWTGARTSDDSSGGSHDDDSGSGGSGHDDS